MKIDDDDVMEFNKAYLAFRAMADQKEYEAAAEIIRSFIDVSDFHIALIGATNATIYNFVQNCNDRVVSPLQFTFMITKMITLVDHKDFSDWPDKILV